MTTETITWIAVADRLPDDDRNVLQAAPVAMVWPGYCVNGVLYSADGCAYAAGEVTHWAEMPKGPESQCQRKDPEPEIAFLRRVADARQQIIDGMIAERCAKQDAEMPRPLADWHEDDGAVVWWRFLVDEPAWIGTPLDDDWPGYHTHWTPHPKLPERER